MPQQLHQFQVWESALCTREEDVIDEPEDDEPMGNSVKEAHASSTVIEPKVVNMQCPDRVQNDTEQLLLNTCQQMVHNTVTTHLQSFLCGKNSPQ